MAVEASECRLTKLEVARSQLGTALWLYLEDLDPVSIHTLIGAAGEIAEHLARDVGQSPFIEHVLKTNPDMTPKGYYVLARQFYNAFKHLRANDGSLRNDDALLAEFEDYHNDAPLFVAWTDYMAAAGSAPIEAQVFQAWFFASHPDKMATDEIALKYLAAFPMLDGLSRFERKRALKAQISLVRMNEEVMSDHRTDRRALLLNGTRR